MKKLLYICEQRALELDLSGNSWTVKREYLATDDGVRKLSRWLGRQRWLSVSVLIDCADVSWELQALPLMSGFTRWRYLKAMKNELRNSGAWWRVAVLQQQNGSRQCSLAQLSLQQSDGPRIWKPLLDNYRQKISAVHSALMLAGSYIVPQTHDADTLLCGRCSDQHCWHLFYRKGVLHYVRILPLQRNPAASLQKIQESLQYVQDEDTSANTAPALLLTDEIGVNLPSIQKALGSELISSVLECELDPSRGGTTTETGSLIQVSKTQQHLFDQMLGKPSVLRKYQLSHSGALLAQCRVLSRWLVVTPVLYFFNLVLLLVMLTGLAYGHSMKTKLAELNESAAQLLRAQSLLPVSAQDMRDTVLLEEHLRAGTPDTVSMLIHLAEAVFIEPELVLKRVEWLAGVPQIEDSPEPLNTSLTAEHYQVIQVDEQAQAEVVVRLTGFLTAGEGTINQSFARYTEFTQALSGLPGVRLIAERAPHDSATLNSVSIENSRNAAAEFSILLGYKERAL